MAKKRSPYFDDFITMVSFSVKAAEMLLHNLENFDSEKLSDYWREMHEIEHQEDEFKHDMMHRLVQEFVTPIDREDIILLANELDTVTDKIEDILIQMYMYNIKAMQPEAIDLARVIVRCTKALETAMEEFPNFQKSKTLMQCIIDVNSMEEEGDALYIRAVRDLHKSNEEALHTFVWSKLYDRLEDCCDSCERVAGAMETISMKNT